MACPVYFGRNRTEQAIMGRPKYNLAGQQRQAAQTCLCWPDKFYFSPLSMSCPVYFGRNRTEQAIMGRPKYNLAGLQRQAAQTCLCWPDKFYFFPLIMA